MTIRNIPSQLDDKEYSLTTLLLGTFLRGKAHGNAKKTFAQGDIYTGNYFMDRYVLLYVRNSIRIIDIKYSTLNTNIQYDLMFCFFT